MVCLIILIALVKKETTLDILRSSATLPVTDKETKISVKAIAISSLTYLNKLR